MFPSLGRLARRARPIAGGSTNASTSKSGSIPTFLWRCRVCATTSRPSAPQTMWKRRRPLANWMIGRQSF